MTEIGSIQDLDEALAAFKANPNTHNQSVLERAMRVYQCNVTAVEPVRRKLLWPPVEMDGIIGRTCHQCASENACMYHDPFPAIRN